MIKKQSRGDDLPHEEILQGVDDTELRRETWGYAKALGFAESELRLLAPDPSGNPEPAPLRRSLRDPIEEIRVTAHQMSDAVDAHLTGDAKRAELLFLAANNLSVRAWTNSLWGKSSPYVKLREASEMKASSPVALRMPTAAQKRALHARDGYHCRYCGNPVVRKEVRKRACELYPRTVTWSRRIADQHAGFQAMWAQYDHVVPHTAGGTNDLENLVVCCAGCNFGKMSYRLEQLGLYDPRDYPPLRSDWDGLERLLAA